MPDSLIPSPSDLARIAERLRLSPTELIDRADRHTMDVQAWLSSRSPTAKRFLGQGIRASSTGIHVPLLNLALGAAFPTDAQLSDVDAEIEAVKAFFRERGVPWYWWMGPHPQPTDLPARLEQHEIMCDSPLLPTMVAALKDYVPDAAPSAPPEVRTWRATTLDDLRAASTIRRSAFRFPEGTALDYFEAMPESWLNNPDARLYLSARGDAPAAIGALIMGAGIPGVYVMASIPVQQRSGLGKAVLRAIMQDAMESGIDMIVLTASSRGFGLYRQFGFVHIFDYQIFRPAPSETSG